MTDNGLVASNNDSYDLYNSANILLSLKYHYMMETTEYPSEDQSEDYSDSINQDDDNIMKKTPNSIPYGSKVKIIKDKMYKSFTGTIIQSKHGFYTVLLDNILIEIKLRWYGFKVID